jgi:hypothetical protein
MMVKVENNLPVTVTAFNMAQTNKENSEIKAAKVLSETSVILLLYQEWFSYLVKLNLATGNQKVTFV